VRNVSVEWSETETPVLFVRRELIADSGGAGRWRGGLGEELALTVEPSADVAPGIPLVLSGSAGRTRFSAEGVSGGRPGSLGWIAVNDKPIAPTSAPDLRFMPGDLVRLKTPGGGGHGDPAQRSETAVKSDLADGYVSAWPDRSQKPGGAGRDPE
jgi:N-methylhydantoinase B